MPSYSRKDFFETLLSPTQRSEERVGEDPIFRKYANKELPEAKSTMSLSLDEYTGSWTEKEAKHLIYRTTFGARQKDIATITGLSMSDAVEKLLAPTTAIQDPPVNNYSPIGAGDIMGVPYGTTWIKSYYGEANLNFARIESLKAWWMGALIDQELNITEKMTFFWHNHFATQTLVVEDARFSYIYYQLLRNNVLGNFKQLVKAVTLDPAMLQYLNGYLNTMTKPDENYARELQELFTLGKNNVPNYNEDDIKSVARILTGWTQNASVFESFFIPQRHDTGDKKFSSFYNNKVIAGRTGTAGTAELDELIDMIFEKSEAAHFICTKLYRFFVYYNITNEIDTNIITPLAQILIANNFEVMPVMLKLLKSQHFYDAYNMGCYIKTPLDFYVGTLRMLEVDLSAAASVKERYDILYSLHKYISLNGLMLGDPPNVAGWPAFYQSPAYYQIWINATTLPARMQFSDSLVMEGIDTGTNVRLVASVLNYVKNCPDVADPQLLVYWLVKNMLVVDISDNAKNNLINILLSGQAEHAYWTAAWNQYLAEPDEMNTGIVSGRLRSLFITIFRFPEYQLC